jgi:hypothetical protein
MTDTNPTVTIVATETEIVMGAETETEIESEETGAVTKGAERLMETKS